MDLKRISKTNLLGVLEFTTALILALSVLPPKPGGAVIAIAILRCAIRFLQQDADLVKAVLPSGQIADVPGHPEPDNSANVAEVVANPTQSQEKS